MNPVYMPLLAALAGAIIGSVSSVIVIVIQAWITNRRELMRQAVDLAIEDYRGSLELAKLMPGRSLNLAPLDVYLHHHAQVLRALVKGDFTAETLAHIKKSNDSLMAVMRS
jgi:hypothetical protein